MKCWLLVAGCWSLVARTRCWSLVARRWSGISIRASASRHPDQQPATSNQQPATRLRVAWLAAAALLCGGCIFHDAPPPRYYAPPSALAGAEDPVPVQSRSARPLRLGRVYAAAYLTEQMVWRSSDVEYGLYEQRRWTDFPSSYLKRALVQALDRTGAVRRVDVGGVPTLDVELVAFDEVLMPAHEAAVAAVASLRAADQSAIFDRTFAVRRSIPDDAPASVARAMGAALDDVVQQIATQVAAQLPAH
jgi:ABC-type uncharacterized transport system auxiliary subunit